MDDFYVTVMSDSSINLFPNNTIAAFRCKLPVPIDVNKEEWKVALSQITYPGAIYTVSEDEADIILALPNGVLGVDLIERGPYHVTLPVGNYQSARDLINTITKFVDAKLQTLLRVGSRASFQMKMIGANGLIRIEVRPEDLVLNLRFHHCLAQKLGNITATGLTVLHTVQYYANRGAAVGLSPFSEPVNLLVNDNTVYVYVDFIEPVIVSNNSNQLLRVFPFKGRSKDNQYSTNEFNHNQYVPLSHSRFDEFSVRINNVHGDPIHFVDGKCILTLHFMRGDSGSYLF